MRPTKFVWGRISWPTKQSYVKELHNNFDAAAQLVSSVDHGTVAKETCIAAPKRSYNLGCRRKRAAEHLR